MIFRSQNFIPEDETRWRWFRFPVRRFFFLLWAQQAAGQLWSMPEQFPPPFSTRRIAATDEIWTDDSSSHIDDQMINRTEKGERIVRKKAKRGRKPKDSTIEESEFDTFSLSSMYQIYNNRLSSASFGPRVRMSQRLQPPIKAKIEEQDEYDSVVMEDSWIDRTEPPKTKRGRKKKTSKEDKPKV